MAINVLLNSIIPRLFTDLPRQFAQKNNCNDDINL